MTKRTKDARKIVLMGLDKAGKTSVLLCLKGKTELSAFNQLPPTLGLNRDFIEDENNEFVIFDFGGQEAYVEEYLSNLDEHLDETDKFIFIIDMQDTNRMQLAVEYLGKILEYLGAKDKKPPVSVFFHKMDKIEASGQHLHAQTAHDLMDRISKITPDGLDVEYFTTSIFAVFQKARIN